MRIFVTFHLVFMLILLINLIGSDLIRLSRHSDVNEALVVRHYLRDNQQKVEPRRKNAQQIHLEKEIRYIGSVFVGGVNHENLTFTGRKLLVKQRESQEELSNANYKNSKKKLSHGTTRGMNRAKNKNANQTGEGRVGAFTEDYRLPRPHPPRNN